MRTRTRTIQALLLAGAAVTAAAGCGQEPAQPARTAAPTSAPAAEPAAQPAAAPEEKAPSVKAPEEKAPSVKAPKEKAPEEKAPRKPAPPVVGAVTTTPQLSCPDGWCLLPAGAGTITFNADVTGATRVEFFVVPTGTETWELRRSIGVDRDGRDGWSVRWAYTADDAPMAHLVVEARGPGGTVQESPLNLYRG